MSGALLFAAKSMYNKVATNLTNSILNRKQALHWKSACSYVKKKDLQFLDIHLFIANEAGR